MEAGMAVTATPVALAAAREAQAAVQSPGLRVILRMRPLSSTPEIRHTTLGEGVDQDHGLHPKTTTDHVNHRRRLRRGPRHWWTTDTSSKAAKLVLVKAGAFRNLEDGDELREVRDELREVTE